MKSFIVFCTATCSFMGGSFTFLYAQSFLEGVIHMKTVDSFTDRLDINHPYIVPIKGLYGIDSVYYPFTGLANDSLEKTCRITFSNHALTTQLLQALQTLPICDYAELVPRYFTDFIPNDMHPNQWYLSKIQASGAWNVSTGNQNLIIAIVDNAVRTTHEDLAANMWVNTAEIPNNGIDDDVNGYIDDYIGYDVADGDGNPNPPAGITAADAFNHGTHCAGIASAVTHNGVGIASLGFKTKIMAVKCTRNSEPGNVISASLDGIVYAIRNHADIISMSFSGKGNSITSDLVLKTANAKGIVLIAAAGNDNVSTPYYPAASPGVISVGATNQNDEKATFSNFGPTIDLMAPGVSIYSTIGSSDHDYGFNSGTSMACPMVAGLAALMLAARPDLSPQQIEAYLKNNADNIAANNPGFTGQLGAGRINAQKTLAHIGAVGLISRPQLTASNVFLYPNPFSEQIYIQSEANNATLLLITSAEGREVLRLFSTAKESRVSLEQLSSGIYYAKIVSEGTINYYKLVKY